MPSANFFVMVSEGAGSNPAGSFRKSGSRSLGIGNVELGGRLAKCEHQPCRVVQNRIEDIAAAYFSATTPTSLSPMPSSTLPSARRNSVYALACCW